MRYLLDTNVLLFLLAEPARLRKPVRLELADDKHELFVSAATAWEIAIKVSIGKLILPEDPESYIANRMRQLKMIHLPITFAHAFAVRGLAAHHNDPFDRLLIAQAQMERLTIVTTDRIIGRYDIALLKA